VAAQHGAAQTLSQALGFATGVLVVRSLDKPEYAQYSVVIAIVAAAALIADSGINATVMSIGGALHQDKTALAGLFARAFRVRYIFGAPIIAGAGTWAAVLLIQNGATTGDCILFVAILVFTLLPTLAGGLLRVFYRLELRARYMQAVDIGAAVLRLAIVSIGLWFNIASAAYLLVGGLLVATATVAAFAAGSKAGQMMRSTPTDNAPEFWSNIRRVLPMTVFLVISEQALLAIASFRGDPSIVAEMSALSRFAVAFVVLNAVVSDIIAPRFARAPGDWRRLGKLVAGSFFSYLAIVVCFISLVWAASPLLLALLGSGYSNLTLPLVLFAAGYGIANLAQAMNVIGQARGWVHWSWLYIPLSVAALLLCAFVLPLNSVTDVSVMFVVQCTPALLTQVVRILAGLSRARAREMNGR